VRDEDYSGDVLMTAIEPISGDVMVAALKHLKWRKLAEAERLAARKWHDDTDDDNAYREYIKAREKVDALEGK
jgi:hypothetical protein